MTKYIIAILLSCGIATSASATHFSLEHSTDDFPLEHFQSYEEGNFQVWIKESQAWCEEDESEENRDDLYCLWKRYHKTRVEAYEAYRDAPEGDSSFQVFNKTRLNYTLSEFSQDHDDISLEILKSNQDHIFQFSVLVCKEMLKYLDTRYISLAQHCMPWEYTLRMQEYNSLMLQNNSVPDAGEYMLYPRGGATNTGTSGKPSWKFWD